MDWFKFLTLPLFDVEGGSGAGGGGGGPDPAAGGAPDPAAGGGAPDPAAGGGAPDPAAGGGAPDPAAGGAPEIYRPEGLADHLLGETDQGTIDNMKKALDGYRERDGAVPDDAAAYSAFTEESVPETLRPHIQELSQDPLFSKVSEKAKELRLPVETFQSLTTELYTAAQDAGLLEEPLDIEAEREALTPDHARHLPPGEQQAAREKRMNDNFGWLDLQANDQNSGISKEVAAYVRTELGDSALGHQFFEAMRAKIGGGPGPQGGQAGAAGGDVAEDLTRRAGLPENTPGNSKFDKKSYDLLIADFKKHHGE